MIANIKIETIIHDLYWICQYSKCGRNIVQLFCLNFYTSTMKLMLWVGLLAGDETCITSIKIQNTTLVKWHMVLV